MVFQNGLIIVACLKNVKIELIFGQFDFYSYICNMKINIKQRIKRLGITCSVDGKQFVRGIECVDLGLPSGTLWAKCNLGANSEIDYGKHYQFGYFKPYKETCKKFDLIDFGSINGWTVPTQDQFRELLENTERRWITINRVGGYKFTSKVDETKYVFFPTAGEFYSGNVTDVGIYGYYWSSSLHFIDVQNAYGLRFSRVTMYWQHYDNRRVGRSLRLVFNG